MFVNQTFLRTLPSSCALGRHRRTHRRWIPSVGLCCIRARRAMPHMLWMERIEEGSGTERTNGTVAYRGQKTRGFSVLVGCGSHEKPTCDGAIESTELHQHLTGVLSTKHSSKSNVCLLKSTIYSNIYMCTYIYIYIFL